MSDTMPLPFARFAPAIGRPSALRAAITAATRLPEPQCVPVLLDAATLPRPVRDSARSTARSLIERLRAKGTGGGVQALVQEYALSSQEGVALMCLAEALLRIPDTATRDALIRDKIADGDWASHMGDGRPLFVNAAAWGLAVTGKLVGSVDDTGLTATLTRLIARLGEPAIRAGLDRAMRVMGEQFVTGQTIGQALKRAQKLEARGFSYSYDMLGEAAVTAADAARYQRDYEQAIHAIGTASAGRGIWAGPGISIKLSALHPRYSRAQADRVMGELLPRVQALAALAKSYDIGLNIDAEEADRLEISLDLLEALAGDPALAGWDGLGFVVQAYGKRCPLVIDFVIDLARRTGRRIMVRLVKGAYWDAEIKRAQVDGLSDYPVYTRKVYTDVAYIACAKKLLGARDAVFPQFATHNAQTLATIYHLAGPEFQLGDYEFQCLHGMGESLYDEVVGADKLDRPCRIYAPVGTHETLLAYLVRRLLENGANSSFVNQIGDTSVPVDALIADPVETVAAMAVPGAPHDGIALPAAIYGARRNSAGLDLSSESVLAMLRDALPADAARTWSAGAGDVPRPVLNPSDHRDRVGMVAEMTAGDAAAAAVRALAAASGWAAMPVEARAAMLDRAADLLQEAMAPLIGLLIREAGKSAANAVGEVREAIDFLRYYAAEARRTLTPAHRPLGPVVCISPWNFPLAIFTGQIAAALAAGNTVLAKPAEETPLIAAEAVRILHAAGVPGEVLQLVPGDGVIGAALVGAPEAAGIMFTGSTAVARAIQAELAKRLSADGRPIPLIAETGGQNAMIVDSSALTEQVVPDVIASAFDSAGQRCSALRLLCLQDEIADHTLAMLKGALHELRIGSPTRLAVDVGPVITEEAQGNIQRHIDAMRAAGHKVEQLALPEEAAHGTFVPPTLIEIGSITELTQEVFGPVLHVIRYRRTERDALIAAINATGYGLTFGLHTRLDSTIEQVRDQVRAGNLYVNRNIIGAVVGVQPFGGRGLSGTGPKAGGPHYLGRLVRDAVDLYDTGAGTDRSAPAFVEWLAARDPAAADAARAIVARSPLGREVELAGPVGERNLYALHPRGRVALVARSEAGLRLQLAAVLATGNDAVIDAGTARRGWLESLPETVARRIIWSNEALAAPDIAAALVEGDGPDVTAALRALAGRDGAIVPLQAATPAEIAGGGGYVLEWLLEEVSTSINTTAAGGNATLMALA
ncbi:trifunctional transcriptional regulator/proline dehydrogenase/L-glutamate gamma-semialdehyde dehydrogenase [Sphingomonas sp.]|uniref:trifunctional transcriptional regulator/proline dehydrogenase/L-glutamate gamma-semialdehyde dehydrogenase n=1 Tax=Sphingomonas sp. TaxID=28214 RepID=UPI002CEEF25F|nr:trifunctional transcriptional regulator/proline dehydrogenase/L-glutamate gamma-semialdehyde dehydrogenase [Sphingomonas sp.]HWK34658.1 trifunctional transcriptional regulator/proline dehydrogenase/L-glutamate gamma-semialdehyde dehydrogenase [Sphingomonas sp.]